MPLEIIHRAPSADSRPTPLLCVHGAWHAAWCWGEHFLPYFAQHGYHAYALSLRGHGSSDGRIRGSRLADYLKDVRQAVETLPGPPVLIGHSMGGFVVRKYLETYSDARGGYCWQLRPSPAR